MILVADFIAQLVAQHPGLSATSGARHPSVPPTQEFPMPKLVVLDPDRFMQELRNLGTPLSFANASRNKLTNVIEEWERALPSAQAIGGADLDRLRDAIVAASIPRPEPVVSVAQARRICEENGLVVGNIRAGAPVDFVSGPVGAVTWSWTPSPLDMGRSPEVDGQDEECQVLPDGREFYAAWCDALARLTQIPHGPERRPIDFAFLARAESTAWEILALAQGQGITVGEVLDAREALAQQQTREAQDGPSA